MPVLRLAALLALALVVVRPATTRADTARAAREGEYDKWIPASLLRVGADTLVVLDPESARAETLAVSSLGIVDVEKGAHPSGLNIIRGACVGFLVGAATSGVIYSIAYGDCEGLCGIGVPNYLGVGAIIGGGVGFGIGAIPV